MASSTVCSVGRQPKTNVLSRAYYSVDANTAHKITGHSCTITNSVTEATCGNDKALARPPVTTWIHTSNLT